jgi:hypothetical protein
MTVIAAPPETLVSAAQRLGPNAQEEQRTR